MRIGGQVGMEKKWEWKGPDLKFRSLVALQKAQNEPSRPAGWQRERETEEGNPGVGSGDILTTPGQVSGYFPNPLLRTHAMLQSWI